MVVAAEPLQAQTPQPDSVTASVWQHAARNYWHVRVIVADGDTLTGRVRYVSRQAIVANVAVPDAYLQLDRRLSRGRGMYIGAGIGAVVGGALVGGFAASMSEGRGDANMAALGGAGAGAMLGLLVGHLAAPARHEWIRIWPQP